MMRSKRGLTITAYILIIACFIVAAYGASLATTTVARLIPMERDATVVIDAGHGGVDGGATSCTGVLESRFNLDISLRLKDLLHLLGINTVMVRTTDVSVYTAGETIAAKKMSDLRQRVRLVNETEDALLVSIHQNTFSDSKYYGAQVFHANCEGSRELADLLQQNLKSTINRGSKRNSKKAEGVYLMQHIECTGILVECGFLSNPEEEAKLRSAEYQKKLSAVIGTTVAEFLTK